MESYVESLFAAAQLSADEPTSSLLLARRHGVDIRFGALGRITVDTYARDRRIVLNETLDAAQTNAACALGFARILRGPEPDVAALSHALLLPQAALLKYGEGFYFNESRISDHFVVPLPIVSARIFVLRLATPLQSTSRLRVVPAFSAPVTRAASSAR